MQHYTNQLAKDSSKQLKELHDYSAEDALDPRCDIALPNKHEFVENSDVNYKEWKEGVLAW